MGFAWERSFDTAVDVISKAEIFGLEEDESKLALACSVSVLVGFVLRQAIIPAAIEAGAFEEDEEPAALGGLQD